MRSDGEKYTGIHEMKRIINVPLGFRAVGCSPTRSWKVGKTQRRKARLESGRVPVVVDATSKRVSAPLLGFDCAAARTGFGDAAAEKSGGLDSLDANRREITGGGTLEENKTSEVGVGERGLRVRSR
jgi:hypothetical protein